MNNKISLKYVRYYGPDDPDMKCDPVYEELYHDSTTILFGDWYHDKISTQLQGFLKALDYLGIPYTVLETRVVDEEYI